MTKDNGKFDDIMARMIQQREQTQEAIADFANVMAAMYKGLVENGVPADDAMKMTMVFMETTIRHNNGR